MQIAMQESSSIEQQPEAMARIAPMVERARTSGSARRQTCESASTGHTSADAREAQPADSRTRGRSEGRPASRCSTALVEPPSAITGPCNAFEGSACEDVRRTDPRPDESNRRRSPRAVQSSVAFASILPPGLNWYWQAHAERFGSPTPSCLPVYIPPQLPAPGTAARSTSSSCAVRYAAALHVRSTKLLNIARHDVAMRSARRIVPPYTNTAGRVQARRERHQAAGHVLVATSNCDYAIESLRAPTAVSLIEPGVITSRDVPGEYRIPGESHRDAIGNRDRVEQHGFGAGGIDRLCRGPCQAIDSARCTEPRCSQVEAMPTCGLAKSSSSKTNRAQHGSRRRSR